MADNWQLKAVLSANAQGLLKTLDSVNKATRSTRKHLADIGSGSLKLAQNLALPVGLLGGLAAGFSVAGVVQAAKNFALMGDEVAKGSQKAGLSISEWQRWNYVAGQSGIEAATLNSSMGRLNKQIAEAAAGKNKDLAALFSKARIGMRGANGELRTSSELLPQIADLFARNGNEATRARMGNAIFGKSWQDLAPLLLGGSDGIAQLTLRYKELGLEVEEGAIKAGEAFGDQMDDLNLVTKSYANTIAAKLLPVLSPLLEKTIQWAVANRAVITTKITDFVAGFANAMGRVDWNKVVEGVGGFFNGLMSLVEWLGGARNALIALVVFMNLNSIVALAQIIGSVGKFAFGLYGLAASAVPAAVTSMSTLTMAMASANAGGTTLLGTVGLLVAKLAAAGAAGYAVGTGLSWLIDKGIQSATGDKDASLGTWVYDKFNDDPMAQMNAAAKPNLVGSTNRVQASGAVNIKFENAPPGMRFEQEITRSDIPINTSVGYRSFATGMP
ncbi:hypothetical protein [Rhodoferax sp. TS-BS-61-7]|uniref:hypothetical protein n=1 Tax=Rhodoferax sp. TS-BS-61-7 TaxID=2094194 RepID=UPI000CF6A7AF|nr:hypothetical protein [Rhodoferax sp. TS-BS-61-7]PQA78684.1 hypothetical protein C5F53_01525 [Rhodoferax sp. TS-BS-61-7]